MDLSAVEEIRAARLELNDRVQHEMMARYGAELAADIIEKKDCSADLLLQYIAQCAQCMYTSRSRRSAWQWTVQTIQGTWSLLCIM